MVIDLEAEKRLADVLFVEADIVGEFEYGGVLLSFLPATNGSSRWGPFSSSPIFLWRQMGGKQRREGRMSLKNTRPTMLKKDQYLKAGAGNAGPSYYVMNC